MSTRVAVATRMGFREEARRPLLLVLLIVLPFFFITRAIARTEEAPRVIGLPGGDQVLTTMRDVHGASMVTITVAFLAALCGAFIMRSARSADRRSSSPASAPSKPSCRAWPCSPPPPRSRSSSRWPSPR